MRVLIQRVTRASVKVEGEIVGSIERGLLILVGVEREDTLEDAKYLAQKCVGLRIFDDAEGVMNLSVGQVGGDILAISQFTLHALTKRGNRPSYINAAPEPISRPLYQSFVKELEQLTQKTVATGIFGADMKVELLNDGPVTIFMDSKNMQ
ncbi:MAG: D-aminoacyl-tRNA deacylase [Rikenellaceae bacterium]